jgi:hypothetical protein
VLLEFPVQAKTAPKIWGVAALTVLEDQQRPVAAVEQATKT